MANNSAKKNEQSIKSIKIYLQIGVFILIGWMMGFNTLFLLSETISIWHYLLCVGVCGLSFLMYKQILKCWELQLPSEATEYYYDILAMNAIVHLFDPYSHNVWYFLCNLGIFIGWWLPSWVGLE